MAGSCGEPDGVSEGLTWRNLPAEVQGLLAVGRRVLREPADPAARRLAETVREAATEAFRSGRGEVAVVQDRIDGRPGLVVLHRRPDEPFPRIVDEIVIDPPALSERDARRWPPASSPRARVWRFVAEEAAAGWSGPAGSAGSAGVRP
jgi:hypothetical protein